MNKKFIYEYWNRSEFGQRLIESEYLSEGDLVFLMPNNVKKLHGVPMTRCFKKRKSVYKNSRKRYILCYKAIGCKYCYKAYFCGYNSFNCAICDSLECNCNQAIRHLNKKGS